MTRFLLTSDVVIKKKKEIKCGILGAFAHKMVVWPVYQKSETPPEIFFFFRKANVKGSRNN